MHARLRSIRTIRPSAAALAFGFALVLITTACRSPSIVVPIPTADTPPGPSQGNEHIGGCGSASAPPCDGASSTPPSPERSCVTDGDVRACVQAGDAYANAEAPDFERAIALYTRGCDEGRGDGEACAQVANLLSEDDEPDLASIARYLDHACTLGVLEACLDLGFMYLRPVRGAARDLDRARAFLQPLCDDGFENGCLGISVLFAIQASDVEMGLHGRPDAARARHLYQQSCEVYESGPGCFQLDRLSRSHHFESATYSVRLTTVERAPSWLRPGQRCEITVEWTMDADPVGIRALCAGRPVFPTDSGIEWSEEEGLGDALTSEVDGNPSLLLSPDARTFELSDDATGRLGALRITGSVTRVPPPSE